MTKVAGSGVLVVHPGKQHSYQVALALQQAGMLREFVTGMYYKPAAFPYTLVPWLPRRLRARVVGELDKRRQPGLAPHYVRTWPYAEALSRTIGRARIVNWASDGRIGYPFVNWATDLYVSRRLAAMHPRPVAVLGFLGGVLRTFTRARELGIPTILDIPIVFDAPEILRREYQALGLRTAVRPRPPVARLSRELALADWVITPAPAVADSVRRAGFAGQGIAVVPFGTDTSVFRPAAAPEAGRPFRAVYAGRLEVRKGLHYLLDAWRTAGIDGELVLAGSALEEEFFVSRMRREFRGSFTEAGNLTHEELARLFASSDVFVLPSLAEGSAFVTYEALAAGLPCIVTPETGSVVRDGIEGFVVPARDSRAVADRLRRLHADRDLRKRMSQAAVRRSREFTWDRYHRAIAALVTQNVKPPRGDAAGPAS